MNQNILSTNQWGLAFIGGEKKKKTKGLSPKKCYLPGKLAQPIYHLKRKKKKRKGKVKHFQVPTVQT